MIQLHRIRTETAIHKNFYGVERLRLNQDLIKQELNLLSGIIKKREFDSKIWGNSKKQLFSESFGKCAFCESDTRVVYHGDVEHFRPKSKYWWLAYCYENYLASCAICNQTYKKDSFPVLFEVEFPIQLNANYYNIEELTEKLNSDPLKNDSTDLFFSQISKEKAQLINPYYQNPELYFGYNVNESLRIVDIVPLNEKVRSEVEASIEILGLNRKELQDNRFNKFVEYDTLREAYNQREINESFKKRLFEAIQRMKLPQSQFAGMIRFFDKIQYQSLSSF